MKRVGRKLRWLRHKRLINQQQMAEVLNLSAANYSKIEAGITVLSVSKVYHIAKVFGVSAASLLADDEAAPEYQSRELLELKEALYIAECEIVRLQGMIINYYETIK